MTQRMKKTSDIWAHYRWARRTVTHQLPNVLHCTRFIVVARNNLAITFRNSKAARWGPSFDVEAVTVA
jgi:hypothetical protein